MPFDEEYFNSDDFKELLNSYEDAMESGLPPFLDAEDFIDIADYYNFRGELNRATEVVDYALTLFPEDTLLNVFKARQALQDFDFDAARAFADTIEDKDSPDYHYLHAEILIAEGHADNADEYLRTYYLSVPPDEHADFIKDVINLYVDYEQNQKAYEWLLRSKGDESDDFKELMARTLFGLGKYQDSQRIFNELIDHNPFSKSYWNALASAQFMDEDYPNAVTSSEYAIAIDPKDSESLLTKACSLFRLGNYEEAATYYERYSEVEPADAYALLHRGVCFINLGRNEEAIKLLEQVVGMAPDDPDLLVQSYQELAFCYSATHQIDRALQLLDKTDALPCDHINMQVIRGHLLLENGRVSEAERYFRAALRQSNADPAVALRIIVSLYDNHYVRACYEMFKKFFNIVDEDFTEGYSYMAICCYELNYVEEFLMYLRLAVDRNPQEARMVLSPLFPDEMAAKDYYQYMYKKLKS